jgi:hypothetical protein
MTIGPMSWTPPPGDARSWGEIIQDIINETTYLIGAVFRQDGNAIQDHRNAIRRNFEEMWRRIKWFAIEASEDVGDWASGVFNDVWDDVEDAWDRAQDAYSNLGWSITSGAYTAVSWAIAKRDEVWSWTTDRYDDARAWAQSAWDWVKQEGTWSWNWIRDYAAIVWDWIKFHGDIVWTWIRDKSDHVWSWIRGTGANLSDWWNQRKGALNAWVSTYMSYYQDLFDKHRNDLMDFLDDPVGFIVKDLLLSTVEQWLYARWFGEGR